MTADLWTNLRNARKPVIIYGTGDGADKIYTVCGNKNITVSDIIVSDGFYRGQTFLGRKVKTFAEAKCKYGDFIILVGFGTKHTESIYALADKYELYAPDVPVFGNNLFDLNFYNRNKYLIEQSMNLIENREVLQSVIDFKLSGNIKYLKAIDSSKEDAFRLLGLTAAEQYADIGAYDGDTIGELLAFCGGAKKIYAVEPDIVNFSKLKQKNFDCDLYNIAAWSVKTTLATNGKNNRNTGMTANGGSTYAMPLDDIIKEPVTFIKYDVEGSEYEALDGSIKTINRYKPKLQVALYHRSEDIFRLPLFVNKICGGYKFYIFKHPYIPAWDINLYAVHEEQK